MTMQDPVSDMLTRIRNAQAVNKKEVSMPHSKMKHAVLELLKKEGYVKAVDVAGESKKTIEVALNYVNKEPRITGVTRISKPSKRIYTGVKEIMPVRYGHGMCVISTPKGIMTDKMARKEQVGGEVLFTIW